MKRLWSYTLIFVMFGCVVLMLTAEERTENVNQYYAKWISKDTDGPLSGEAYIEIDVDQPGEGNGFIDKTKSRLETLVRVTA